MCPGSASGWQQSAVHRLQTLASPCQELQMTEILSLYTHMAPLTTSAFKPINILPIFRLTQIVKIIYIQKFEGMSPIEG